MINLLLILIILFSFNISNASKEILKRTLIPLGSASSDVNPFLRHVDDFLRLSGDRTDIPGHIVWRNVLSYLSFMDAVSAFQNKVATEQLIRYYSSKESLSVFAYIFRDIDKGTNPDLNEIRRQFQIFSNDPVAMANIRRVELVRIENRGTFPAYKYAANPTINAIVRSGKEEFARVIFQDKKYVKFYLEVDGSHKAIMNTSARGNVEMIAFMLEGLKSGDDKYAKKLLKLAIKGFIDGNQRGILTKLLQNPQLEQFSIDYRKILRDADRYAVDSRSEIQQEIKDALNSLPSQS